MNPDPINWEKVSYAVFEFKRLIDLDEWENHEEIKRIHGRLTNDERLEAEAKLKEKAPNSGPKGKMYKTLLNEYLAY